MNSKKLLSKKFLFIIIVFFMVLSNDDKVYADANIYPQKIGQFDTLFAWDVVVIDDIAYIGGNEEGLQIIDVSDPRNPIELGHLDLGVTHSIDVINGIAYLANYFSGLQIVNVSNPLNPAKISVFYDGGHVSVFLLWEILSI
jgi:hypothetical protein